MKLLNDNKQRISPKNFSVGEIEQMAAHVVLLVDDVKTLVSNLDTVTELNHKLIALNTELVQRVLILENQLSMHKDNKTVH